MYFLPEEMTMKVDLRIPMGMMFTLMGAVLMAFGLSTKDMAAMYVKSLSIDVDLWWGVVLLVFGLAMVIFGRRGQMAIEKGGKTGIKRLRE
jgi:hypothetical protein